MLISRRALVAFFIAGLCLTAWVRIARADDWKPVDPAEFQSKTSVVEPNADAEGIFWEVRVQDEYDGTIPRTVLWHYIRIRIFTDHGKEAHSSIDITFLNSRKIDNIAGRTIKPDGKILELKKEDIFEKTIVKAGGIKIKAKSFALPGVEPGSIIEYRWKETRNDSLANYMRLDFQRDIPMRVVKYYIKPLEATYSTWGMRAQFFHCPFSPFVKENGGFYSTKMEKVPAFHEEPRMPPEYEVRPWALIYYSEDKKLTPDKYWPQYAKEAHEEVKSRLKVNDDVKKAAAAAVGDASAPEQKLARIFEFCRTKIKNVNSVASGMSAEEREKAKENKTPADTLKRGEGNGNDIDFLFLAMAAAAGFDARVARLADRSDAFFSTEFTDPYFLRAIDIAVRVGDKWKFFDPGSSYIPYGMLRWQEEGVRALVCDPKESAFVETPLSTPDKSKKQRRARVRVDEDGTLEGDVHIEFTGHESIGMKRSYADESSTEREKMLTDSVKLHMSTAELSKIRIENVTDQDKPFTIDYHVKVPNYAQRTGKRLFLQPAFFEYGVAALFPTSDRKYPIYFSYPWSEDDSVTIQVPEGYDLDHADAPGSLTAGPACKYDVKISFDKTARNLEYKRDFFFGGGESILYPAAAYAQLKQVFDVIHERDNHTITFKQAAAAPQ